VDRSLVSRWASGLESADLVRRRPDGRDRRTSLIELTDPGHEVVGELRRRLVEVVDERLAEWSAADRQQIGRLLPRLADALLR
jgi:DNA-binding MarR family transcriptional regulator